MRATCQNFLLFFISYAYSKNEEFSCNKPSMIFLWSLLDVFDIQNPTLLYSSNICKPYLMKQFSQKDIFLQNETGEENSISGGDLVLFFRSHDIATEVVQILKQKLLDNSKVFLVLEDLLLKDIQNMLQIEINQEFYFYEVKTKNVFETYQVNQQNVNSQLGFVNEANEFVWHENIERRYLHLYHPSSFYSVH